MHKEIDLEFELHAYVDGDLDEEAMARVEEYLAQNPETAAKVRAYLQQKDDLRGFAREQAARDEPPAIRALGKKLARRLKPGSLFPWRLAVAVPVFFIAGWLAHMAYLPLTEEPEYAEEFLQAHLLSSSDPSEILPMSPERVSKLFARINEIERLPNFAALGFEPMGAQLLPGDDGLVLHVPYKDPSGAVISWFLLHDNEEAEVPRQLLRMQDVSIVSWQHEHSRYAIAAALGEDQITRIAEYLDSPGDSTTGAF